MTVTVEKDGQLAYDLAQLAGQVGDLPGASFANKFDATAAPTANDDSGDGYGIGSQWVDVTNDQAYVCVDATEAAAVWVEVGGAPSGLITTEHVHAKLVGSDESPDPAVSVDNDGIVSVAVSLKLAAGATVNDISNDDTLADASDTALVTEGAAKAYADSKVPSGVISTAHTHAKLVASDGSPDPALSASATGALTAAVSLTMASGATVNEFSTDGTLGGNSDTALPTEKAVKTYVDSASSPTTHTHSKLVASDGSPDPAFSVDDAGDATAVGSLTVTNKLITPYSTELTIASGIITATGSFHLVDTEGDASTDNLDTINGGTNGMRLVLKTVTSARDVVVKDGSGNMLLAGDCTLDNSADTIELIFYGSNWYELCRSNNA